MFKDNTIFEAPPPEALLWRYQDIPRYIDLLLKQQLFFSRANRFEDPFEGKYLLQQKAGQLKEKAKESLGVPGEKEEVNVVEEVRQLAVQYERKRSYVTVNSWHNNSTENYAMWRIYGQGTYGLAIQTNYQRLKDAFQKTSKEIYIGKVNYYEVECDSKSYENELMAFLHKRNIYAYENEVRCCYVLDENENDFNWDEQDTYDGVFVNVDLETLIERIYISPYSPQWIRDIIAGLNDKFGINKEIVHSTVFDTGDY
ncbi:MAG: hypothetical protein V4717_23630 [Bacteroidota bacterium]